MVGADVSNARSDRRRVLQWCVEARLPDARSQRSMASFGTGEKRFIALLRGSQSNGIKARKHQSVAHRDAHEQRAVALRTRAE